MYIKAVFSVGTVMCQSYLTAMQERWGWLLQVLSCIDVHLKNAQAYNQVFNTQLVQEFSVIDVYFQKQENHEIWQLSFL